MSAAELIAVVGRGGLFPSAPTPEGLWSLIREGRSAAREVPTGRWVLDPARAKRTRPGAAADKVASTRACFIDAAELQLEALALPSALTQRLPEGLLGALDPVYRLGLAAAAQAFSQCRQEALDPQRVELVLGNIALPTQAVSALSQDFFEREFFEETLGQRVPAQARVHPLNRYVTGLPAGLIAQALGLGGGSFTLDAACASSLFAVALGVEALLAHRADAVLAGGLGRPDSLYTHMGFSQLGALSPSGRCRPFDRAGDGLLMGEGAGVFVLKRLSDALAQGDRVQALIRGAGLSNDVDGKLLSPSAEGQLRAMRSAYARSDWSPSQVEHVECHATGTPLGDATELSALRALWQGEHFEAGQCVIGSVKSNVGHLLTGAGAAGLMKTLLALEAKTLPPTAGFEQPIEGLHSKQGAFRVLQKAEAWEPRVAGSPRRAAVSAFGFGGTNAHLLVEEWRGDEDSALPSPAQIELASARGSHANASQPAALAPSPSLALVPTELPFKSKPSSPIAIVGVAGRFGPWQTVTELRDRLLGIETAPQAPKPHRFAGRGAGVEGSGYAIESIELAFGRLRIPPSELKAMLPQQLLMLLVAQEAFESARSGRESHGKSATATGESAEPGTLDEGLRTGAFLGIGLDLNTTQFYARWSALAQEQDQESKTRADAISPPLSADRTMGALGGIVASRIARELKLGGPCFVLSSEESSGLKAVEVAVHALQSGEVDTAIAGAVDLAADPRLLKAEQALRGGAAAPRPFGEGAGAVVLRRLDEAQQRGDTIYAVIEGVGSACAPALPNSAPQQQAFVRAQARAQRAGPQPADAEHAPPKSAAIAARPKEAQTDSQSSHGLAHLKPGPGLLELSGGPLSAQTREALVAAALPAQQAQQVQQTLQVGEAAQSVGHCGAASGLASLLRAVFALHQQVLPATQAASCAEEGAGAEGPQAGVAHPASAWLLAQGCGPRRAAVNAHAVDGSCIHLLLREAPRLAADPPSQSASAKPLSPVAAAPAQRLRSLQPVSEGFAALSNQQLLLLSAQHRQGLATALAQLASELDGGALSTLAQRLAAREATSPGRLGLALIVRDAAEAHRLATLAVALLEDSALDDAALQSRLALASKGRVQCTLAPLGAARTQRGGGAASSSAEALAFVYPGSGNHFPGMGRNQALRWPALFGDHAGPALRAAAPLISKLCWGSSLEQMKQDPAGLIQVQVALGIAQTQLLADLGLSPRYALGYSLGETTALFALGAWKDQALMAQRMRESKLFTEALAGPLNAARALWAETEPVRWQAAVVQRPAAALASALAAEARVYLLIVNTDTECVLGGEARALQAFAVANDLALHPIDGVTSVHCEVVAPVAQDYRSFHRLPTTAPTGVRFYSGAWGESYVPSDERAADAILAQALEGIDMPRVIRQAYADGARVFVELGPGASCTRIIDKVLGDRAHLALPLELAGRDPELTLLLALAQLHAHRLPLNLRPLFDAAPDARHATDASPASPSGRQRLSLPVGLQPPAQPAPLRASANALPSRPAVHGEGGPQANHGASPSAVRAAAVAPPQVAAALAAQPGTMNPGPMKRCTTSPGLQAPQSQTAAVPSALLAAWTEAGRARAQAHQRFLLSSQENLRSLEAGFARLAPSARSGTPPPRLVPPLRKHGALAKAPPATPPRALSFDECVAFATGRLGQVLGAEFAAIDAHPTRVRLPEGPLMLVDRILKIEGTPNSMGPGRVLTEHRVHEGRWYLDEGRIPTGVCVESGQADLFLSAYLGIDRQTRGLAVYRLLDAQVTFHRGLPRLGETILHDIRILGFFKQGETWFFRFEYDSTLDGQPVLTMREGLAGFFTAAALAAGEGIKHSRLDKESHSPRPPLQLPALTPLPRAEAYPAAALALVRQGALRQAFGAVFDDLPFPLPPPELAPRLPLGPDGMLALINSVSRCDAFEGWYGRGLIRAHKAIHADDWFLRCHFVDDQVMPGTLMYESALQALRVYLLRLGVVAPRTELCFEPVPGVRSRLKCRGQVTSSTREVIYELHIKSLVFDPQPQVIADVMMFADAKAIVEIEDMSLQATGFDLARLSAAPRPVAAARGPYEQDRIVAYAEGKPSEAFGEPYRIFDQERRIARLPRAPYLFLDRVSSVQGKPFEFKAGARCEAELCLPADAWVFGEAKQADLPFSVLLEIALQPCGWLAAYVGSALQSQTDLHFRNLGGKATQRAQSGPGSGRLQTYTRLTQAAHSGDTIIQHFDFKVCDADPETGTERCVYEGSTYFGFFTAAALADQVGLRGASLYALPAGGPALHPSAPSLDRAGSQGPSLKMLDALEHLSLEGGPHGLGLVQGRKRINPDEWFFQAHFYQDPVWPGSLGIEAFLQLLRAYAGVRFGATRFSAVAGAAAQEQAWTYRGQVIPSDQAVTVQAAITKVDESLRQVWADGLLEVDGRIIYEMKNFGIRCEEPV